MARDDFEVFSENIWLGVNGLSGRALLGILSLPKRYVSLVICVFSDLLEKYY